MEQMERIILEHLAINNKLFLSHLNEIVEFTSDMLKDNNIQIGNKCLNILLAIISSNNLNLKQNQQLLVTSLTTKLSDSKVTIKQ